MDRESYEAFLIGTNVKMVAIYGMSSRAKVCFNWLAENYPTVDIVGFIPDSQTDLQEFRGKPVHSLGYIKRQPEIVIIYQKPLPFIQVHHTGWRSYGMLLFNQKGFRRVNL